MNFRNNRGFSLIEVVVSGAILALVLLGVVDFTKFISTANRSNVVSGNFAQVLSNMDSVIKTPDCDVLFANLPLVGSTVGPQIFPAGVGLGTTPSGFTLNPATTPPSGFAFMGQTPGDANHSFQFTVLKNAATTLPGFPNIKQDTVDFQVAMKKVDSSGKALPGAAVQTKDYILNLWVDTNTNRTISPGPNGGTCTYNIPSVWNVVVNPAPCNSPGAPVTITWQQQPVSAIATVHPSWGTALPVPPGVRTLTTTTGPADTLGDTVTVSIVDSLGNTATSVPSAAFNSVYPPTLSVVLPQPTFTTLPEPTLNFGVTTTHVAGLGGSGVQVTGPAAYPVIGSPYTMTSDNGINAVPVNLLGPFTSPQTFNYNVTASNVCYAATPSVVTATFLSSCAGTCALAYPACTPGLPYWDGCAGVTNGCTCPACTPNCAANATTCSGVTYPDSCGGTCTGTKGPSCPVPTSCAAPSTTDSCGNVCPCTGSPHPTCSPVPSTITPTLLANGGVILGWYEYGTTNSRTVVGYSGSQGAYNNPSNATDGNAATAAIFQVEHSHQYGSAIWGFSSPGGPAGPTALNVTSEVVMNFGDGQGPTTRSASISYSTDGGTSWIDIYNSAPGSTRPKTTDTVTLSPTQDLSKLQVMAFVDAHDDMGQAVYEINATAPAACPSTSPSPSPSVSPSSGSSLVSGSVCAIEITFASANTCQHTEQYCLNGFVDPTSTSLTQGSEPCLSAQTGGYCYLRSLPAVISTSSLYQNRGVCDQCPSGYHNGSISGVPSASGLQNGTNVICN